MYSVELNISLLQVLKTLKCWVKMLDKTQSNNSKNYLEERCSYLSKFCSSSAGESNFYMFSFFFRFLLLFFVVFSPSIFRFFGNNLLF